MKDTTTTILSNEQREKILEVTPKEYIKYREGRGGKKFAYVEGSYIIQKLNETFNYLWSFDITDRQLEGNQVAVCGKLTVYLSSELSISKSQWGSSDIISFRSGDKTPLGDAYKSAATDAMKKCATLFGIAADVYSGGTEEADNVPSQSLATNGQKMLIKKFIDSGKLNMELSYLNNRLTFEEAKDYISKYNNG